MYQTEATQLMNSWIEKYTRLVSSRLDEAAVRISDIEDRAQIITYTVQHKEIEDKDCVRN